MKKILFILSPSLALYNHFKNLLKELKDYGDELDIFLPKPVTYKNIVNELNNISSELEIKEFLVLKNPLNPFSIIKLNVTDIKKLTTKKSFKFQVFLRSFTSRIIKKFEIKNINPFVGNFIRYISSKHFFIRLGIIKIFKINHDAILYDLFEEKKYYLFPYLNYFYKLQRFSLFHGNGISSTHFFNKPFWNPVNKLTILDYTGLNKSQYLFNLSTKNFKYSVIGIPNHFYEKKRLINSRSKVINLIKSELNLSKETLFMTLISRPNDSNYCNTVDREDYLKTIGSYLSKNNKWHLLIKAHPKEEAYTKEKWATLLGLSVNNNNFSITKKSSLELASISSLGFSFVSTCCIDFASFGKPLIELTSLHKTKFRNSTILFSQNGIPLTAEAFHKLTINLKSIEELILFLNDIENNIKKYSKTVKLAYDNCYGLKLYKPETFINLVHNN